MEKCPKVSVIIPVYGVEHFIERCAVSLMEQTLDDVEYIFIDDASKDQSIDILRNVIDRYPNKRNQVKIVVHKENHGLPAARNTGLEHASGEYIYHCDSDDYLETNALELLYGQAKGENADIVWCDWFLTFEHNERYMHQPGFNSSFEALKSMLGGGMKYNVWNKLVRRKLYVENRIDFPTGHSMGEDMTMILLFAYAKKVCYLPQALYHYVKTNAQSISNVFSKTNCESLKYNVERISTTLINMYGAHIKKELAFFKLEAKFPFLIMAPNFSYYRLWQEWYPEANCYILKNNNVSLRSRLIQYCASNKWYWLVWLHYQLVCRIFYGVVYK